MSESDLMPAFAQHPDADPVSRIDEAITTRRSVRGFMPTQVPLALVRKLLDDAARAPSGTNMQPWQGYIIGGEKLSELSDAVSHAHFNAAASHDQEYKYYPDKFFEPYLSRRRKVGWDLYGLCGIPKGDKQGMMRQAGRNYIFFDAPMGLMFTIDKRLERGSWLDYGMFLQNIMVGARAYGLHTCPQAAWAHYHRIVKDVLQIPETDTVVCGMAIGFEDKRLAENQLRTERVASTDFMTDLSGQTDPA